MTLRPIIAALSMQCMALTACRPRANASSPASASELRTDSAGYGVQFDGRMYRTIIGYTFTNRSGGTVSQTICGGPQPPLLEKEVSPGRWVRAYSPVYKMCLTLPPFRLANGGTYRGVLSVAAGARGGRLAPTWDVDSISGMYRLSWTLHASADPDDGAGAITTVSPAFQLRRPM
jgi:hypothetical protein